ncbi:MAG: aldehyde dehydrogenase [Bacteriovoracia bacterium]
MKVNILRQAANKSALTFHRRVELLNSLKAVLIKDQAQIGVALKKDLGKCSFEAWSTEIGFLTGEISHFVKDLPSMMSPEKVATPLTMQPGASYIYKEPYGVVLVLAPWNYPVQLAFSPLIGAIAAGNRVVIKPSEMTPHCAQVIADVVAQVFSEEEVQVVLGGVEETTQLLKEQFDYIFFTGSTAVGKVVMRAAAEHLTPITLELGGKSPCLIDESANLAVAAKRVAWGKWMNAGQTCVAPDYVLIPKKLEASFLVEIKKAIEQFYSASPQQSPDFGRIVNERHFDRLVKLMADAEIVCGGQHDRTERFIAPTILRGVSENHPIMQDEIFGPLLPIMTYENFDEAISFIKKRNKPLALYLFTQNKDSEKKVLESVSFGGGCINDTVIHLANSELPFGGVGPSGMGAYHGKLSFETFSHKKAVFKQTTMVDVPVRYPPYKGKEGLLKFLIG